MTNKELAKKLVDELKPYINMDGGNIEFVDYEDNYLYIKLTGACQDCMFQENTINDNILEYFKKSIPNIDGVINISI